MNPKLLEEQIRKTGFVLENQVAQDLKTAGWTVISNKYYVDDFEDSVREIDLVAYQVQKVQHCDLFTVLVISCKKSAANIWALLARDANLKDPNSDWWPLHAWSNDKAVTFQLGEPAAGRKFHEAVRAFGVEEAFVHPAVEVFAFQEMDGKSGAPQNDKPIFAAVTSLMKAQAYELGALPLRKKSPSVYQFNLISVVDAEMARLMFQGDKITCESIDSEHYLARYIVKKKETFSRIRFVNSKVFADGLADYGRLHRASAQWFDSQCNAFYDDIVNDRRRYSVLLPEFMKEVRWLLEYRIRHKLNKRVEVKEPWFNWRKETSILAIELTVDPDVIEFLNQDQESMKRVALTLSSVFRYSGLFVFAEDDIPF
jgi:hypothetical protein